jgi:integrin alpha FG-GAP repeat containing protein 1
MGLTLAGLYEIDSGLNPTDDDDPAIGHMMAYADLNSDMYTDIIALNEDPSVLNLFYFNPKHLRFYLGNQVKTTDCKQILNVAVGRSFSHLRLFVTCEASSGSTIVRFFDRKDDGYVEVPKYFTIESNSHPFVGDLNGDFLDDLMFTDVSGGIKIAFQVVMVGEETFVIKDFAAAIPLAKPEPGCMTPVASNRLTSPHSVSMIDFDGDCMSDLFVTVQDSNSGAKFYEIWLRRET